MENISNLNFINELWTAVNTSNSTLKWSKCGGFIIIDFSSLDDYLLSNSSVFQTMSRLIFLHHLNMFGFRRFSIECADKITCPITFGFQHESFKQNQPELLQNISMSGEKDSVSTNMIANVSQIDQNEILKSAPGKLRRARSEFGAILRSKTSNIQLFENTNTIKIESPRLSVSGFPLNHDYAGYYGNINRDDLHAYYGQYLPVYPVIANTNAEEILNIKSIEENNFPEVNEEKEYENMNIKTETPDFFANFEELVHDVCSDIENEDLLEFSEQQNNL